MKKILTFLLLLFTLSGCSFACDFLIYFKQNRVIIFLEDTFLSRVDLQITKVNKLKKDEIVKKNLKAIEGSIFEYQVQQEGLYVIQVGQYDVEYFMAKKRYGK